MNSPAWLSGAADWASVLGAVAMFAQGFMFSKKYIEYRNKLKKLQIPEINPDIVINLSGHAIIQSEGDWHKSKKIIEIKVGNIKLDELDDESERILEMVIKEAKMELNNGVPIIFALPGMSVLTQYLIPKIHGLSGTFPIITTSIQTNNGFTYTKPVNLHVIRTNTRFCRIN